MISRKPLVTRKTVRKRNWFLRWGWALFLLVLAGGGVAWYFLLGPGAAAHGANTGSILNRTTKVTTGDVAITASGSGTLVASQTVDLSFSTSGTVVELNVDTGDKVKTGDVLAKLGETKTLEASLASANLELLQANKTLEELQKNAGLNLATAYQDWITARATYADELTASQRTAYARCSQEVMTKYTAALERTNEKLEELRNSGAYGSDEWIDAQHDYDTAFANYTYCASYTEDEKASAKSSLEVAKLEMEQAEEKYNALKDNSGIDPDEWTQAEAAVDAAQTALDDAQEMLDGITLIAPIDGIVTSISAGVGEIVDTSTFLTIADISHPTIEVSVDENDIDKFKVGKSATIVFDALPDLSFTGIVTQVNPSLTTYGQYRVIQGVVQLGEDAVATVQELPLGLNASVTIVSQEAKEVLVIPATALKQSQTGEYNVMVQTSDGQFVSTVVEVGLQNDDTAQITAGLNEGDIVSLGITVSETGSGSSDEEQFDPMMMGGGMPPDGGGGGGMMGPP